MKSTTATSVVIDLQTHPVWLSAQRHREEVLAAMRRHPSYRPAEHLPGEPA